MLNKLRNRLDQFILGRGYRPSIQNQKLSLLLGQLAILSLIISLVYVVSDTLIGVTDYRLVFVLMGITSVLVFILNRSGWYFLAATILILATNFIIYIFSAAQLENQSVQMFFTLVAVSGLALFSGKKMLRFLILLLPLILFLTCNFFPFSLLPQIEMTAEAIKVDYYVNVITAFCGVILVVSFLINNNSRSESLLLKNEAELVAIRKRYELAIKGSRAGIWEYDILSDEIYNSPVWKAMLGFREDEFSSINLKSFMDRVHPEDKDKVANAAQAHLYNKMPYLLEFRLIKEDGSILWVLDSGQAVWDEQGNPTKMVGSIVDIGERRKAEEKIIEQNVLLAKANKELDRFVYSASHDLRSPLSSILGLINLMEKANDKNEAQTYLGLMRGRIKVLDDFIKEIVSYSQNARLEVENKTFNLHRFATEVVDNLKFAEEAKDLDIVINCPMDLMVYTDARRLNVILNNLIGNAIKYKDASKLKPFVVIDAKSISSGCEICIKDNGIGISENHLPKIFDMFYRASDKSYGSGLGLYIVKETMEKMGGTISVESQHHQGSLFKLSLVSVNGVHTV
jgi:PAS domain S-box-containing protein